MGIVGFIKDPVSNVPKPPAPVESPEVVEQVVENQESSAGKGVDEPTLMHGNHDLDSVVSVMGVGPENRSQEERESGGLLFQVAENPRRFKRRPIVRSPCKDKKSPNIDSPNSDKRRKKGLGLLPVILLIWIDLLITGRIFLNWIQKLE
ncbi:hypothetical protein Hanom_Chr01g00002841 [Helianthus anomalus]